MRNVRAADSSTLRLLLLFFMFLVAKVLVVFVSQPVSLPRRSGHNNLVSSFPRWIAMSTVVSCPNSLVSFFPAMISKSYSDVDVLPELVTKPTTVQFLRNGTVCITFKDTAPCNDVAPLWDSSQSQGRLVYLPDLPCEVPDASVRAFRRPFGEVHSFVAPHHEAPPDILNGTHLVKMTLFKDIPSSLRHAGFEYRVWYHR